MGNLYTLRIPISVSECALHFCSVNHVMDNFLVKPNEVTPGIPDEEFERRRKALMDSLPENSIVVAVAGHVKYMSGRE